MQKIMLRSKIHRATVTECDLDYIGSIEIDELLMKKTELLPYEQVQIYNITNGERFTTYAIKGEAGSGRISVNGAAAHKVKKGDMIIIVAYALINEEEAFNHKPKIIVVDENNAPIE
ncbi:MAG: aspartate 1-decarboxylase [Nitrospinae bacterium]|nr:aspartate 1-decarboxylase [Nitrospinota bacterium]